MNTRQRMGLGWLIIGVVAMMSSDILWITLLLTAIFIIGIVLFLVD
ncbi:unnamed protein product [marine sediment metagenome]|uniref:Uncharacterized protein n=1 Tax=marine sediment metagenome TaxID=412755 RepID=X0WPQ9_9ZZZZ